MALLWLPVLLVPLFSASAQLSDSYKGPLPIEYSSLKLGDVDFNMSSTNQDARDWFKYGLLHLFTFGYDYAPLAFQTSRRIDPDFALAYAFEALCHFWPLWDKDDLTTANAVLDQAPTATDPQEEKYVFAVRRHFEEGLPNETRHANGVEALVDLTRQNPHDASAHALLGVWRIVLSSFQDKVAETATLQAAEVDIAAALALEPRHTGALHYQLHLFDNPTDASKGIPSAELFPVVAPDASHAVHMPVHIYLQLFKFRKAYAADTLAVQGADTVCHLYGLGDNEGCDIGNLYHSLEYRHYAAYQIGLWKDAKVAFDRMNDNFTSAFETNHTMAGELENVWMRMDAREIFERGLIMLSEDEDALTNVKCSQPKKKDPGFWSSHTESGALLAHGLCYVFKHRPPASGGSERENLTDIRKRLFDVPTEFGSNDNHAGNHFVHKVNVMHVHMLDAADSFVQGKHAAAWEEADKAIAIQDALVRVASSPTILFIGAHEFKGMLLLQAGDVTSAKMAEAAYENATTQQGRQLSTYLGLARAKRLQGCGGDAKKAFEIVAEMLQPDSDEAALPYWAELQSGLLLTGECRQVDDEGSRGAVPLLAALASSLMLVLF